MVVSRISVLAFLLCLLGPGVVGEPTFAEGPIVMLTDTSLCLQVTWRLENPTSQNCIISWGTASLESSVSSQETGDTGENAHRHTVQLCQLQSHVSYTYTVTCDGTTFKGNFLSPPDNSVSTSTTPSSVRFMAYGDTRSHLDVHNDLAGEMLALIKSTPDFGSFILLSGDFVLRGAEASYWTHEFFNATEAPNLKQLLSQVPYMACMGNHEMYTSGKDDLNATLFREKFPYPYVDSSAFYWSFAYGPDVRVFVVDQYHDYGANTKQLQWLEQNLAQSTAKWKFVMFHEPGWSCGEWHHDEDPMVMVKTLIQPLCLKYNVQVTFGAHNHVYCRFDSEGVQHLTLGGGGAGLYDVFMWNYTDASYMAGKEAHHYARLEIEGDFFLGSVWDLEATEGRIDTWVSPAKRPWRWCGTLTSQGSPSCPTTTPDLQWSTSTAYNDSQWGESRTVTGEGEELGQCTAECVVVARKVVAVSNVSWTQANVVLELWNVGTATVYVNGVQLSTPVAMKGTAAASTAEVYVSLSGAPLQVGLNVFAVKVSGSSTALPQVQFAAAAGHAVATLPEAPVAELGSFGGWKPSVAVVGIAAALLLVAVLGVGTAVCHLRRKPEGEGEKAGAFVQLEDLHTDILPSLLPEGSPIQL